MAKPTEPEAETVVVGEPEKTSEPEPKSKAPKCPHCGDKLREEHDVGDHMHCDSPKCVDCCFEPSEDGPRLRPNYPTCPSDTSR